MADLLSTASSCCSTLASSYNTAPDSCAAAALLQEDCHQLQKVSVNTSTSTAAAAAATTTTSASSSSSHQDDTSKLTLLSLRKRAMARRALSGESHKRTTSGVCDLFLPSQNSPTKKNGNKQVCRRSSSFSPDSSSSLTTITTTTQQHDWPRLPKRHSAPATLSRWSSLSTETAPPTVKRRSLHDSVTSFQDDSHALLVSTEEASAATNANTNKATPRNVGQVVDLAMLHFHLFDMTKDDDTHDDNDDNYDDYSEYSEYSDTEFCRWDSASWGKDTIPHIKCCRQQQPQPQQQQEHQDEDEGCQCPLHTTTTRRGTSSSSSLSSPSSTHMLSHNNNNNNNNNNNIKIHGPPKRPIRTP